MGNVLQGGGGQARGRQAAIHAGLPGTVPALTINKVCGSGLKAVMLAAQAIKAGDEQCIVAGGMESMSNAPHYVYGMRSGIKAGNSQLVDGMIHDGLWDSFSNTHMGNLAEYSAKKAGVSREDQDRFALASHQKAVAAMAACRFAAETVKVEIAGKKGATVVEKDEGPRPDTTLEALAALKPSFEQNGRAPPGKAPGLNAGGGALVVASLAFAQAHGLEPLARITAYATGGGEPKDLFFAPIVAVRNLMAKAKTTIADYDLIEANEAFAVQALADGRALGWHWDRVNVNGGARAPRADDAAAAGGAAGGRPAGAVARRGEHDPLPRTRGGWAAGIHAVRPPRDRPAHRTDRRLPARVSGGGVRRRQAGGRRAAVGPDRTRGTRGPRAHPFGRRGAARDPDRQRRKRRATRDAPVRDRRSAEAGHRDPGLATQPESVPRAPVTARVSFAARAKGTGAAVAWIVAFAFLGGAATWALDQVRPHSDPRWWLAWGSLVSVVGFGLATSLVGRG